MRSYGQCVGVRYSAEQQLIDAESARLAAREHLREMGINECAEPGCEKRPRSRGKCQTHYVAELRAERKIQQRNTQ